MTTNLANLEGTEPSHTVLHELIPHRHARSATILLLQAYAHRDMTTTSMSTTTSMASTSTTSTGEEITRATTGVATKTTALAESFAESSSSSLSGNDDPLLDRYVLSKCPMAAATAPTAAGDDGAFAPVYVFPSSTAKPSSYFGNLVATAATSGENYFACDVAGGLRIAFNSSATNVGEKSVVVESQNTLRTLQEALLAANPDGDRDENGFSLEVFVFPSFTGDSTTDGDGSYEQPILSVGAAEASDGGGNSCPADLRLGQSRRHLVLRYVDDDAARSCRVLVLTNFFPPPPIDDGDGGSATPPPAEVVHVVVTWTDRYTSLYRDGVPVIRNAPNQFDTTLRAWNPQGKLRLFASSSSSSATTTTFRGSVQQVSFFDRAIDQREALDLYRRGISLYDPDRDGSIVFVGVDEVTRITGASIAQNSKGRVRIPVPQFRIGTTGGESLSSADVAAAVLTLAVEVLAVPRLGTLAIGDEPVALRRYYKGPIDGGGVGGVNDQLAFQYALSSNESFTVPPLNAKGVRLPLLEEESFAFRLVALDKKNETNVLAVSANATQILNVVHVNHRPTLLAPRSVAMGSSDSAPTILVSGVYLDDSADRNMNLVRVDVWASAGRLSLNRKYRSLADLEKCRRRTYSPWQCAGDGESDRNMTFVAAPSDVNFLLEDLEYRGFVEGRSDEIVVRVSDGLGGSCLSEQEHGRYEDEFGNFFSTLHDGCYQVETTIHVLEYDDDGRFDDAGIFGIPNLDFKNFGLADFLFWVVVFVLLCGCFICWKQCPRCLARGSPIDADDDEEPEEDQSAASAPAWLEGCREPV